MSLHSLERHLERMVDGVFRRAFRTRVRPIELGRRLIRELDAAVTTSYDGRSVAPNHVVVRLNDQDHDELAPVRDALLSELAEAAREYARSEGWTFDGDVVVELVVDTDLRPGRFDIVTTRQPSTQRNNGVVDTKTAVSCLVLASGERFALGSDVVSIGRSKACEVTLADPNASRRHAEVRPQGNGYLVVDLGSTNGTLVNGLTVLGDRLLADGDVIGIGATTVRFEVR